MLKRNFLLALSLIVVQPTYSSTNKEVAELCLKAADFKGCVEIMSSQKDLDKFKVSKDSKIKKQNYSISKINGKCDAGKKNYSTTLIHKSFGRKPIKEKVYFSCLTQAEYAKKKYELQNNPFPWSEIDTTNQNNQQIKTVLNGQKEIEFNKKKGNNSMSNFLYILGAGINGYNAGRWGSGYQPNYDSMNLRNKMNSQKFHNNLNNFSNSANQSLKRTQQFNTQRTYFNWNNNDTYRSVPGVQSFDSRTNTPGWVQNERTGSFHQCTGLGFCTD